MKNIRIIFTFIAMISILLVSCQKDFDKTTTLVPKSIKLADAKKYFEKAIAEMPNVSSFSDSLSLRLENPIPQWNLSEQGIGSDIPSLLVEVSNAQFKFGEIGDIRLWFYVDSIGNIDAKYVLFLADSTYHVQKQGKYSPTDFSGFLLVFNLSNTLEKKLYVKNGLIVGTDVSISIITNGRYTNTNTNPSKCYREQVMVYTECPDNCGCLSGICAAVITITRCEGGGIGGGGFSGGSLSSGDIGTRGGGGGLPSNLFGNASHYQTLMIRAGLPFGTTTRFRTLFPDEFMKLGEILYMDDNSEESKNFVNSYVRALMRGSINPARDLRELFNQITLLSRLFPSVISDDTIFEEVVLHIESNNYSRDALNLAVIHLDKLANSVIMEAYRVAGRPNIGTEAWRIALALDPPMVNGEQICSESFRFTERTLNNTVASGLKHFCIGFTSPQGQLMKIDIAYLAIEIPLSNQNQATIASMMAINNAIATIQTRYNANPTIIPSSEEFMTVLARNLNSTLGLVGTGNNSGFAMVTHFGFGSVPYDIPFIERYLISRNNICQ